MTNKYYSNVSIIVLLLTCILFNVLLSKRYYSEQPILKGSDQDLYSSMAIGLLDGHDYFIFENRKVDMGREVTPFYSILVAAAYYIGGVNIMSVYILNVIFNCLTIIIIFNTMRLITKKVLLSFILSFAFLFYYPLWKMNFLIMMEVTTVFFFTLTIYLLGKYFYKNVLKYLYFSIISFSFLCLINNRFIILFIFFCVFLIALTFIKHLSIGKGFIFPIILAVTILSPWFVRQYTVYDQFVFFTPLWNNVVVSNFGIFKRVNIPTAAESVKSKKPYEYKEYIKDLQGYNTIEIQRSRIFAFTYKKYKEVLYRHKDNVSIRFFFFKRYFTLFYNDFQFLHPYDYRLVPPSTKYYKVIQMTILLPLLLMSFLGFLFSIKKLEIYIIILWCFFFLHLLIHMLMGYTDRYRLTILPVLVILSVYGISELLNVAIKSKYIMGKKHYISLWKTIG